MGNLQFSPVCCEIILARVLPCVVVKEIAGEGEGRKEGGEESCG